MLKTIKIWISASTFPTKYNFEHLSKIISKSTSLDFLTAPCLKRYKDNLRVIFDQWPKLNLGLDSLSNQKILNGI